MRADVRVFGRAMALALAGVLAGAPAASAQGIYGTLQLQFQRSEEDQVVVSDTTRRSVRVVRSQWLRALDLHQQNYLRRELLLDSNVRVSEVLQGQSSDLSRAPQGSMRLIHPSFQITASYQPTMTRNTIQGGPGASALAGRDTLPERTTTTRFRETLLSGHFANGSLPQLDLSWARRRREQDATGVVIATGDQSTQRNVRLAYNRERWTMYGSNSGQEQLDGLGRKSTQDQWSGGFTRRLPVRRDLGFNVQYDGNTVRSRYGDRRDSRTSSQNAGLDGDWRPSARYGASLRYQMRVTDGGGGASRQTDQDGSLLLRATPSRIASITAGGGVRTARTITNKPALERYATAIGTIQGKVRRDWSATGSASHTTSWDAESGTASVQTLNGSTLMTFGRRAHVDGSLQFSRNGGAAAASQRYSNVWMVRMQATPLRTLETIVSLRSTRVGPTLLQPTGLARGAGLDVRWRPLKPFELQSSLSTSGILPYDRPRSTSQSVTARWAQSAHWQIDGSWSKSTSPGSLDGLLASRVSESQSARLQWTPSRRIAMSGNVTRRDPGRATETRQLDAVFVWSFGR
jgi:hypothetical protein